MRRRLLPAVALLVLLAPVLAGCVTVCDPPETEGPRECYEVGPFEILSGLDAIVNPR